jgi:hypothetical protein
MAPHKYNYSYMPIKSKKTFELIKYANILDLISFVELILN